MEPRLPQDILYRPKMGFAVPLARWFRGPLRERMRATLCRGELVDSGMFNAAYMRRRVDEHESGARDHGTPIWTLIMFDAFLRNTLAGTARPAALSKAA
jgi:asparagine synthase (glutamine-hydrolysing)